MKDDEVGFLTKTDLVAAHGLIGNLMHASNPYNEELRLEQIERHFPEWRAKLIRLKQPFGPIPDDRSVLYVGMQNESGNVQLICS
jgi:hypothetical protein